MKLIVKCPNCSRDMIVGESSSAAAKTAFTVKKECTGCKKGLVIKVDVEAKVDAPAETTKKE